MEFERRHPRNKIFEYMMPSSCWAENDDSHTLMIDLPGFKKEEVRIRADDNYENIIVSGERQTNDINKIIHFEQSFKVPHTCNIEDTSGILEDDIFYVTLPKRRQSTQEQKIPQVQSLIQKDDDTRNKEVASQEDEREVGHTVSADDPSSNNSLLDKISKNLKKNRCFVLTTLSAFSLGVAVSHYHHSTKQRSKDLNK
ncbi:hypothetical protein ACS0TY_034456 [Phlomoides rotata]